jgi:uncharacterized protein (TIGR00369 family)
MADPNAPADYHGLVGLRLRPDPDHPNQEEVVLALGPQHMRTLGIAHGGVIAGLMDVTLGKTAASTSPDGHYVVTAQLNIHFIRPAWEGETLIGRAIIDHAGRRTSVVHGELRTEAGALVATASGTFLHLPRPASPNGAIERRK